MNWVSTLLIDRNDLSVIIPAPIGKLSSVDTIKEENTVTISVAIAVSREFYTWILLDCKEIFHGRLGKKS